jgi:hypothetical protein
MNQTCRLAAILAADVRRSASGVTRQRRHRLGMAARHPKPTQRRVSSVRFYPLPSTRPTLPSVLSPRGGDGLPLHVGNRVGTATGKRLYVIFPVAGTSTAGSAGRWAGVLALELPRYFTRSVLFRRKRGRGQRNRSRRVSDRNNFAAAPLIPSASRSLIAPAGIQTLGSDFEFEGELHQLQPSVGKPASLGEFA